MIKPDKFFTFLLFLLFTTLIQAQPYWGNGSPNLPISGLTPSQVAELGEMRIDFLEESSGLRNDLQINLQKLRNSYFRGVDAESTETLRQEVYRLEEEIDSIYAKYRDEMRSILTEEQKAAYDRWQASVPGYGFWGAGRGMGFSGGGMGFRGGYGRGCRGGWQPGLGWGSGRTIGSGWLPGRNWTSPRFRNWW